MENLFRKEVMENKRHRLEGAVSLVQPPLFRTLAVMIVAIVIISLIFLSVGKYTRKERVSGVIEPNTGILRLKAPQTGVLSQVLVSEGQYVEQGAPLLRIASAKHSTHAVELNQALLNQYTFQLHSLEQRIEQQQRQNKLALSKLNQQKSSAQARLLELEAQSQTFSERLSLNAQMVSQISTLKGTGYISELELQRQKDTLLSLRQQASSIQSERLSLQSQIEQLVNQLEQLPLEQSDHLSQLQSQKAELQIQLSSVEQQRLGELRAPKSGIVSGLMAKVGKNVVNGQNLLSVLPENSQMQAIIFVPTSAFGFVKEGLLTRLRYHAFPYEKFGVYDGHVIEVSQSVIFPDETNTPGIISAPAYRVVVDIKQQHVKAYGKESALRPGMTLDADVILEERSLLRWLFDPVFSIKGQL
ncbi:Colicin V secretion protein CvaA [Pseudoalteromonas holothuriae]|uniref:Colicin V secretion protein CvaA n=1 Tax=Pseudoalteromonas holothuriae TaxID=2963714 RepID=A0A9W4W503_9GAMM|nr:MULTISPECIES: HlyD family efflux transporter periplasmic adaptor subunit [unclassified Pseudoalteromonas]CAH9060223.1 Colicin V secretion protein CvaA [Pseudoalteromonas sp. CIP111854]CAH9063414.1 Colicin V secretion protein CvaA [Pseudoalteromonas sp. CIP111951]